MAGMAEMLAVAQAQAEGKNAGPRMLGRLASRFASGYSSGRDRKREREKNQLEVMLKMAEFADRQASMQQKQAEQAALQKGMEMNENLLKSVGVMPHTPEEENLARGVTFSSIGGDKKTSNDRSGKLAQFLDDYEVRGLTTGKYGPRVSVGRKESGPLGDKKDANYHKTVRALAREFALAEMVERARASGEQDEYAISQMRLNGPSPDVEEKYIPLAEAWMSGDRKTYDKSRESIRNEIMPFGDLNDEDE